MEKYFRNDEINAHINLLLDNGVMADSNSYKGMSVCDEEKLTSLLIQATPYSELPTPSTLDVHNGLYTMIARYVGSTTPEAAVALADYLKNLFVDHFKKTILELMDEKINERKQ